MIEYLKDPIIIIFILAKFLSEKSFKFAGIHQRNSYTGKKKGGRYMKSIEI